MCVTMLQIHRKSKEAADEPSRVIREMAPTPHQEHEAL
jgi:hypothetical protein